MANTTKNTQQKIERFHRVAEKRVNNLLNGVRLLAQCSNRRLYEYTDEEVRCMFREIEQELRRAKQSFNSQYTRKGFKF